MFSNPLFWLIVAAVSIVVVILFVGIFSFARGGKFNERNSNRLMRWRIYAQFVALVLIVLFAWIYSRG